MKLTQFFSAVFFLVTTAVFAQAVDDASQLDTTWGALWDFFKPSMVASALVLLADAKKWMFTGEWSFSVFFKTKAMPFILGSAVSVAIYYVLALAPWSQSFIEVLGGQEFGTISAAGISGMATAIINGVLKRKEGSNNQENA